MAGATVAFSTVQNACTVSALSFANWLTVSTTFTGNAGTVTYAAAANISGSSRSGNIQIGDKVYTVTQVGANCSFSLNSSGASYNLLGGSGAVLGSANLGSCPAPVVGTTQPTIFTLGALTGPAANIYTQNYIVNPFSSATKVTRRASITFGGQIFTIKQTSY